MTLEEQIHEAEITLASCAKASTDAREQLNELRKQKRVILLIKVSELVNEALAAMCEVDPYSGLGRALGSLRDDISKELRK